MCVCVPVGVCTHACLCVSVRVGVCEQHSIKQSLHSKVIREYGLCAPV